MVGCRAVVLEPWVALKLALGVVIVTALTMSFVQDSAAANESSGLAQEQSSELTDLARTPQSDCQQCYYLRAFQLMFPIPTRYAVIGEKLQTHECIEFVAPSEPLLRRTPDKKSMTKLLVASGLIRYCPRSTLDTAAKKQSDAVRPTSVSQDGAATITLWEAQPPKSRFTLVYITVGDEGLWIADVNNSLWKVMWSSAKRSALPGDQRFRREP